jgi:hypothetical protein
MSLKEDLEEKGIGHIKYSSLTDVFVSIEQRFCPLCERYSLKECSNLFTCRNCGVVLMLHIAWKVIEKPISDERSEESGKD